MNGKQGSNLWARFSELEEKGLDAPNLTDEERTVVLQLQETLKAIREGGKPFVRLQDAAKESGDAFMIELAKFNCRMAFISARTSDEVCRLVGMVRENAETVRKQFELAKDNADKDKEVARRADTKADRAIYIAIASLFVTIIIGVVFGCVAHQDSNSTTNEIRQGTQVLIHAIERRLTK